MYMYQIQTVIEFCISKVANIYCCSRDYLMNECIVQDHKTHSDKQLPDGIVCKDLLICEGDFKWAVLLSPLIWPVLLTLLLSPLHCISYHGNHMDLFLPHQPPEVSNSVWEGTYKVQNLN